MTSPEADGLVQHLDGNGIERARPRRFDDQKAPVVDVEVFQAVGDPVPVRSHVRRDPSGAAELGEEGGLVLDVVDATGAGSPAEPRRKSQQFVGGEFVGAPHAWSEAPRRQGERTHDVISRNES